MVRSIRGPEQDCVGLEHLVLYLRPVVLFFADVVGGASEASPAASDGLPSEVDVFVGLPRLLEDVYEDVLGDPLDEDALAVADGAPAAGVDSQDHGLHLPDHGGVAFFDEIGDSVCHVFDMDPKFLEFL